MEACEAAEASYFGMITNGCSPQIARSVLPNCLKTEIVMTANFREWRHFITLRTAKAAHPQIRPLAKSILEVLTQYAPNVFSDLNNIGIGGYATGGVVPQTNSIVAKVTLSRGWYECKKCKAAFESPSEPPLNHICKCKDQ